MKFVCVGRVVKIVGLRGEVKVDTNMPEEFLIHKSIIIADDTYTITKMRLHKSMPVIKLEGVNSYEEAELLLRKDVHIEKEQFSRQEDEYFESDLLGLKVENNGEIIGTLKKIIPLGHSDLYVVQGEKEILIPSRKEFIKEIDLNEGIIRVELLEGMF